MIPKTRQEAIAKKVDQYFTGKPCPRGHISNRRVSGACCACASDLFRRYRRMNPEKAKAWKADDQKKHRDSANRRCRKYREANKEKVQAGIAAWAKSNPAKVAEKVARRRAAKRNQMPVWADRDAIKRIYERAQSFRVTGQDVHVDHIIPLQSKIVCGLHVHQNLQILSATMNRSKSNILKEY